MLKRFTKTIALFIVLTLVLSLIAGCGSNKEKTPENADVNTEQTTDNPENNGVQAPENTENAENTVDQTPYTTKNYGTVRTDITGQQLVAEMGVGWNLGNTFDSGYEYGWGSPTITKSMIDFVAKSGFKTLRIPVTWSEYIGIQPEYTMDSTYLDRIEEVVNYGLANDMFVIVNIHHDDWTSLGDVNSGGNSTAWTDEEAAEIKDQFAAVWKQIAERFADYGDHVMFELLNEPREYGSGSQWGGGTAHGRALLNDLNQLGVDTIRALGGNNAYRFIMTPTYAAGTNSTSMQGYTRPNDPTDPDYTMKRIILSCHAYNSGLAVGDTKWKNSNANDIDNIFKGGNAVNATAERCGNMPVVMGEFAWINNDNLTSRAIHSQYYIWSAKQNGYACIWWDGMNTQPNTAESTGLLIRDPANPRWAFPEIVDALMNGYSGDSGLTSEPGIKVDPAERILKLGISPASATVQLTAYVFPLNGSQNVSWESMNPEIATVDSSGFVNSISQGTVTITATSENGGHVANVTITVKPDTTTRYNKLFDFDSEGLEGIAEGDRHDTSNTYSVAKLGNGWDSSVLQISDIVKTPGQAEAVDGVYEWTDLSILIPAENAEFIRRSHYLSYDILIKVSDASPEFFYQGTVLKTGATLPVDSNQKWWDERYENISGETLEIISIDNVDYYHLKFETTVGDHLQYIVLSTAVSCNFVFGNIKTSATAYIDNILFATEAGAWKYPEFPEIPATDVAVTGVTIKAPANAHFEGDTLYIAEGASMQLEVEITPANATCKGVYNWTSNFDKLPVEKATGVITGIEPYNYAASITVKTANSGITSPKFNVIVSQPVSEIVLDKNTANLSTGESVTLVPTVTTTGTSDTIAITTVFFTSSDESVATVDANGEVTAVGTGTVTITAASKVDQTKTAECQVTVS